MRVKGRSSTACREHDRERSVQHLHATTHRDGLQRIKLFVLEHCQICTIVDERTSRSVHGTVAIMLAQARSHRLHTALCDVHQDLEVCCEYNHARVQYSNREREKCRTGERNLGFQHPAART
jgi:hypothetical protein